MSLDLDFKDRGLFRRSRRCEGLSALAALTLLLGQDPLLDDFGQMRVLASPMSGGSALLSAWLFGPGCRIGLRLCFGGGGLFFGFGSEDLLLLKSDLGFELSDA
jgi:hypothetical protein